MVAAGAPIEAVLNYETVCIPRDMMRKGRMFALRVRGDSMIDEQIREARLDHLEIAADRRKWSDRGGVDRW